MTFMGLFESAQGLANTSSNIVDLLRYVSKLKDEKGRECKGEILGATYGEEELESYLDGLWFDLREMSLQLHTLIAEINNEYSSKND